MVERTPITAAIVVITVSTTLRRWITGLGASLGTYPPEAKYKKSSQTCNCKIQQEAITSLSMATVLQVHLAFLKLLLLKMVQCCYYIMCTRYKFCKCSLDSQKCLLEDKAIMFSNKHA